MKKQLLFFIALLTGVMMQAQTTCCPYIVSPTLVPANPLTTDNVKIVVQVTTPSQGSKIGNSQVTVNALTHFINVEACYWQGMATALKTFTDTVTVGNLGAGAWNFVYTAYQSSSDLNCLHNDTNSTSLSFNVSVPAGIDKHTKSKVLELYPNPASEKLYLSNLQSAAIRILSVSGALIRTAELKQDRSIDISDLKPGVYFIEATTAGEKLNAKFIKQTSN